MKPRRRLLLPIASVLIVMLLGTCTRTKTSYSAICARCLQHASGIEKSVFGITFYRKEAHRQVHGGLSSPDIFGPPIAEIDPHLYEEIVGHPCDHAFMRSGFCRESLGMVGCGIYGGGMRYRFRNTLIENLYRAYLRVPDKSLARESHDLIDKLFPVSSTRNTPSPPIRNQLEVEMLPNEPLSILVRGLALVNTPLEWRQVLDAAHAGNGSLELLQNRRLLATRLEHPDPAVRLQAIDQLAAQSKPEAWALVSGCLNDPKIRQHAVERILSARYLPLFAAVFESEEKARSPNSTIVDPVRYVPGVFNYVIKDLTTQEIRALFAQQRPHSDRICLAAIRHQDRFEFLDEVLALLNRIPSEVAVATVEGLLEGPYPLDVRQSSNGKSAKDPWASLAANTNMGFVENMSLTSGGKRMYRIQQEVVRLGNRRDPGQWPKLCELRKQWVSDGGAEWWSAAFAQAMAESDRQKTLDLLANELDSREIRYRQTAAALAGLGAIADQGSVPALEGFRQKSKGGFFERNAHYKKFLDFALHRCRQIHRWKLVKHADSSYSIEKPGEALEAGK